MKSLALPIPLEQKYGMRGDYRAANEPRHRRSMRENNGELDLRGHYRRPTYTLRSTYYTNILRVYSRPATLPLPASRVHTRAHTPRDSRERLAASSLVTIRRRVSRESQRRQRNSFAEANCSSSSSLYPWRASRIKRPWRVTFSNTFTNAPSRFPLVASMRLLFLLRSSKPHDRLFPFDPTAHEDAVINQTVLKVER